MSGGGFCQVPAWLTELQPTPYALMVYVHLALMGHMNPGTAQYVSCHPSQATLAKRIGCSRETVKRAIRELETLGALTKERRETPRGDQTSNAYTLQFGAVQAPASVRAAATKSTGGVTTDPTPRVTTDPQPITPSTKKTSLSCTTAGMTGPAHVVVAVPERDQLPTGTDAAKWGRYADDWNCTPAEAHTAVSKVRRSEKCTEDQAVNYVQGIVDNRRPDRLIAYLAGVIRNGPDQIPAAAEPPDNGLDGDGFAIQPRQEQYR